MQRLLGTAALALLLPLAGCVGSPQPAPLEPLPLEAPGAVCEQLHWRLDAPPLAAGREAALRISLVNPCAHDILAAHSTRRPTLEAEGRDGRATIARDELVAASLLALPAGGARSWDYSWTPPTAGDAALVVDYPELYGDYQHLRGHRFAVTVAP